MIETISVRQLNLAAPLQNGRIAFVTAASGLVCVGEYLYVIGDDENHLTVFRTNDSSPGVSHQLFPGELPLEYSARKRLKPDLEALTLLPPHVNSPYGALLALPSGSKPNRTKGALLPLSASGKVETGFRELDLTFLYRLLDGHFDPPNIEAAAVQGENLYLVHRGNKKGSQNVMLAVKLAAFLSRLSSKDLFTTQDIVVNQSIELEKLDGVPFTITDAAPLEDNRLVFTAVAEKTESTYDDGPCLGAGVGIMDLAGQVIFFDQLRQCRKLEGVSAKVSGDSIHLLLVNDEDDASRPSELLQATIPNQK